MPSRDRLLRQLFELSVLTLVTVFIWIGYGVYTALTEPANTNVTAVELQPPPLPLSSEQFEPFQDRLTIGEELLGTFSVSTGFRAELSPPPPPVVSPPSSPSATTVESSPSATEIPSSPSATPAP